MGYTNPICYHVSMAVKTNFSTDQLATLLANYDIGRVEDRLPLPHGNDQTNIGVVTSKEKYVFRYYEKRSEEYVRYEIDLLDNLSRHQFPSPGPILSKTGNTIGYYQGKPFVLFAFMAGEHQSSAESAVLVAEVIGQLHTLTQGFRPKHAESRAGYDTPYILEHAAANAVDLPDQEANRRLDWLQRGLAQVELPMTLPKGAVHGDLNPSNFLYQGDTLTAVLDFDQSSYTYLLHDVAHLLYWWTWPPDKIDWDVAARLLHAYETQRALSIEEKAHLYDMLLMINFISMGWDFATDDFLESQQRVNYLRSVGRGECYLRIFGAKA
jgi:homoserine kinase type II